MRLFCCVNLCPCPVHPLLSLLCCTMQVYAHHPDPGRLVVFVAWADSTFYNREPKWFGPDRADTLDQKGPWEESSVLLGEGGLRTKERQGETKTGMGDIVRSGWCREGCWIGESKGYTDDRGYGREQDKEKIVWGRDEKRGPGKWQRWSRHQRLTFIRRKTSVWCESRLSFKLYWGLPVLFLSFSSIFFLPSLPVFAEQLLLLKLFRLILLQLVCCPLLHYRYSLLPHLSPPPPLHPFYTDSIYASHC